MTDHSVPKDRLMIVHVRELLVDDVVRDFYADDPTFGVITSRVDGGFAVTWDNGIENVIHDKIGTHLASIIRALREGETPPQPWLSR